MIPSFLYLTILTKGIFCQKKINILTKLEPIESWNCTKPRQILLHLIHLYTSIGIHKNHANLSNGNIKFIQFSIYIYAEHVLLRDKSIRFPWTHKRSFFWRLCFWRVYETLVTLTVCTDAWFSNEVHKGNILLTFNEINVK